MHVPFQLFLTIVHFAKGETEAQSFPRPHSWGWIRSEESDSGLGESKAYVLEMKKIMWTSSSPCKNIEIIKHKIVVKASLAFKD